jgi:ribosomal protein L37E
MTDRRIEDATYTCERCGERMTENHCKIVCGNCGYSRDCSDP